MQPKAGDGTQDVRRRQDANWYGQSQEPQEEYTNDTSGVGGYSAPLKGGTGKKKTDESTR